MTGGHNEVSDSFSLNFLLGCMFMFDAGNDHSCRQLLLGGVSLDIFRRLWMKVVVVCG